MDAVARAGAERNGVGLLRPDGVEGHRRCDLFGHGRARRIDHSRLVFFLGPAEEVIVVARRRRISQRHRLTVGLFGGRDRIRVDILKLGIRLHFIADVHFHRRVPAIEPRIAADRQRLTDLVLILRIGVPAVELVARPRRRFHKVSLVHRYARRRSTRGRHALAGKERIIDAVGNGVARDLLHLRIHRHIGLDVRQRIRGLPGSRILYFAPARGTGVGHAELIACVRRNGEALVPVVINGLAQPLAAIRECRIKMLTERQRHQELFLLRGQHTHRRIFAGFEHVGISRAAVRVLFLRLRAERHAVRRHAHRVELVTRLDFDFELCALAVVDRSRLVKQRRARQPGRIIRDRMGLRRPLCKQLNVRLFQFQRSARSITGPFDFFPVCIRRLRIPVSEGRAVRDRRDVGDRDRRALLCLEVLRPHRRQVVLRVLPHERHLARRLRHFPDLLPDRLKRDIPLDSGDDPLAGSLI